MSENADASNEEELNYLRSELEAHRSRIEHLDSQLFYFEEIKQALPVVKALEFRTQKFDDPNYMQALLQKAVLQTPLYKWGRSIIIGFILIGVVIWTGGTVYSGIQISAIQEQASEVSRQSENFLGTVNTRVREITEEAINSTQRFAQQTADLKRVAEKHVKTIEENLSTAKSDAQEIANAKEDLSQVVGKAGALFGASQETNNGVADLDTARTSLAEIERSIAAADKITIWSVRDRMDDTVFFIVCGVLFFTGFAALALVFRVMRQTARWIASAFAGKQAHPLPLAIPLRPRNRSFDPAA